MGSVRLAPVVAFIAVFVFHAFAASGQPAQDANEPFSEFEMWLAEQRDGAGRACDRRAVQVAGDHSVVACGESGLWIARRNPAGGYQLVRTDDLGGPVVGLFKRDDRIWAEIARREARDVHPAGESTSSAAFPGESVPIRSTETPLRALVAPRSPATPVAATGRASEPEGRVTEVLLGEVVVDLGRKHGLRHRDRVELSVVTSLDAGGEEAQRRDVVAVGVVVAVSERFARVELGINERVPVGAFAQRVARLPTRSRVAPPRLGGLWHAGFMARPFVALDDLGGGVLTEGSVGYRFESDLHVEALLSPLGWGTGEDKPSTTPVAAFAKLSFDPHLFEVGLGVGGETVHDTAFGTDSGSGVAFIQQLRLGARDGLHLDMRGHAVLFHSRFAFSGFVGSGQIPVGQRWWLLFTGGGGSAGYGFGEIAVRALVLGNGDRGSFFFTGSAGGAGVFESKSITCTGDGFTFPCPESVLYAGPMLGVGGEWRF
jgi:hypothetical protein